MVRIDPEGAMFERLTLFAKTRGRSDPLYDDKGPDRAISHSDHRRRVRETAIPLHRALFVVGKARERVDILTPEIAPDDDVPMFVPSTASCERAAVPVSLID